jgi:hypothetical protein
MERRAETISNDLLYELRSKEKFLKLLLTLDEIKNINDTA